MELIENLISLISIGYILSVSMATYFVIALVNAFRKTGIKTAAKRIITVVVGTALCGLYYHINLITIEVAIPSFFLSMLIYDYVVKGILNKFSTLKHKG